jgi:DNA-binding NtrC family response regulator
MSSTLTVLSEETEKFTEKVGKLKRTQVAKESKRMAASKKKAPAEKKAKSLTSTDQVAKVIRRHIQPAEGDIFDEGSTTPLYEAVKDYEKRLILEALEKSNWVKSRAARLLRINRTTLVAKIKNQNLTEGAPVI